MFLSSSCSRRRKLPANVTDRCSSFNLSSTPRASNQLSLARESTQKPGKPITRLIPAPWYWTRLAIEIASSSFLHSSSLLSAVRVGREGFPVAVALITFHWSGCSRGTLGLFSVFPSCFPFFVVLAVMSCCFSSPERSVSLLMSLCLRGTAYSLEFD